MNILNFFLKPIRYSTHGKGCFLFNLLSYFFYIYKRNRWMWDLSWLWRDFRDIKIDRPVFLLGTHSGGLTLISRSIRRHKDFVSVSGNYKYWSGADEMTLVLGPILPPALTGIKHKIPPLSGLKSPTHWLYASDKYARYFRRTKENYTPESKKKFEKIIRWIIAKNAIDKNKARFIDKSQLFTVKVSFINEILKQSKPKFILVTRNPYAVCYCKAIRKYGSFEENNINPFEERLKITAQHWANSMHYALKDSEEADLMVVKLEDYLQNPKRELERICKFVEIEFSEDLLPQPEHKIPFGSKGHGKWYPLRLNVNEKHFEKMTEKDIEIVNRYVHEYAKKLGYSKLKINRK